MKTKYDEVIRIKKLIGLPMNPDLKAGLLRLSSSQLHLLRMDIQDMRAIVIDRASRGDSDAQTK